MHDHSPNRYGNCELAHSTEPSYVLRALGRKRPRPVFIVVTNDPTDGYRKACMAAGATEFLDKSHEFMRIPQIIADAAEHPLTQQ